MTPYGSTIRIPFGRNRIVVSQAVISVSNSKLVHQLINIVENCNVKSFNVTT